MNRDRMPLVGAGLALLVLVMLVTVDLSIPPGHAVLTSLFGLSPLIACAVVPCPAPRPSAPWPSAQRSPPAGGTTPWAPPSSTSGSSTWSWSASLRSRSRPCGCTARTVRAALGHRRGGPAGHPAGPADPPRGRRGRHPLPVRGPRHAGRGRPVRLLPLREPRPVPHRRRPWQGDRRSGAGSPGDPRLPPVRSAAGVADRRRPRDGRLPGRLLRRGGVRHRTARRGERARPAHPPQRRAPSPAARAHHRRSELIDLPPALPLGLGLGPGWPRDVAAVTMPWAPGDRLLLYTDGLSEARDRSGRFLDLSSLADGLRDTVDVEAALDDVLDHVAGHVPRGHLEDDLALLLLENTASASERPPADEDLTLRVALSCPASWTCSAIPRRAQTRSATTGGRPRLARR